MLINSGFITYKNNFKNPSNKRMVTFKNSVKSYGVQFKGSQKNTLKAVFLSLIALVTAPALYAKTVGKLTEFKGINIPAIRIPSQIKTPSLPKLLCANFESFDYLKELQTLSEQVPFKLSYYFEKGKSEKEIIRKKLEDYKKLVEDIPQSIKEKGLLSVSNYQKSIVAILKTCGEYGAMYIKNIPDKENILIHAQGLERLSNAAKKIQGFEFNNSALFNGFNADDLMKKVVIPNEKVAKGEEVGKNQNNLIIITHQFGSDTEFGFIKDFSDSTYLKKHINIPEVGKYDFDEGFLEHYNNILVIQPKLHADNVLNEAFDKIDKAISKGAKTDIMVIAHGVGGYGMKLITPKDGFYEGIFLLDKNDFAERKPFVQSIFNIFQNSINKGYHPRFIGNGCKSEFLQECVDKLLGENAKNVRVFGTPYNIKGVSYFGFSKEGFLSFITKVSPFFNEKKIGLLIKLTETDRVQPDWQKTSSFLLQRDNEEKATALGSKIISDYTNGILHGTAFKPNSNMAMSYQVLEFKYPK